MDFVNRFKSYLGLSPGVTAPDTYGEDQVRIPSSNRINDRIIVRENPNQLRPDDYDRFGFNVFSNPLEMHRYFEHQMNEMMKSFGMLGDHDSFFGNSVFGGGREPFFDDKALGNNDISQFPGLGEFQKPPGGSLREQYLRPGYEQNTTNEGSKSDQDLDGKFDIVDLDSVLTSSSVQTQPRSFIFGQSMTTKTIRNPDGSIETHKSVTDQQGNQETTTTRKQGDKEYTVTTRTDKNGHQEIIENLVNIEENDKYTFFKNDKPHEKLIDDNNTFVTHWFPFDKFFK